MPRLPGDDIFSGIPSARSGRPIAREDTSARYEGAKAFGRGLQQAGAGIFDVAEAVAKRDRAFEARLGEFLDGERRRLTQAAENAGPDASDTLLAEFDDNTDAYLESLPRRQQRLLGPEVDAERVRLDEAFAALGQQFRNSTASASQGEAAPSSTDAAVVFDPDDPNTADAAFLTSGDRDRGYGFAIAPVPEIGLVPPLRATAVTDAHAAGNPALAAEPAAVAAFPEGASQEVAPAVVPAATAEPVAPAVAPATPETFGWRTPIVAPANHAHAGPHQITPTPGGVGVGGQLIRANAMPETVTHPGQTPASVNDDGTAREPYGPVSPIGNLVRLGLISNAEAGAIHADLAAAIFAGDAGAAQRILSTLEDRAAAAADIGDEAAAQALREAAAHMARLVANVLPPAGERAEPARAAIANDTAQPLVAQQAGIEPEPARVAEVGAPAASTPALPAGGYNFSAPFVETSLGQPAPFGPPDFSAEQIEGWYPDAQVAQADGLYRQELEAIIDQWPPRGHDDALAIERVNAAYGAFLTAQVLAGRSAPLGDVPFAIDIRREIWDVLPAIIEDVTPGTFRLMLDVLGGPGVDAVNGNRTELLVNFLASEFEVESLSVAIRAGLIDPVAVEAAADDPLHFRPGVPIGANELIGAIRGVPPELAPHIGPRIDFDQIADGTGGPFPPSVRAGGHDYPVTTRITDGTVLRVTPEEMANYLRQSMVPGVTTPVENYGIYRVLHPRPIWRFLPSPGLVMVFISPDGLTGVNRAIPGRHTFAGGQVTRTAWMAEDGSWYVTTRGFGNNFRSGMDTANKRVGPGVFEAMDEQLRDNIRRDHGLPVFPAVPFVSSLPFLRR